MAAIDRATSPIKPRRLNATPPNCPESSTTNATPRLAPELIPSTEGPANGLRKMVCICKPLIDNPAPATKAVKACGRRDFRIIFCQATGSPSPPVKIFQTEANGMDTDPNSRFNNRNTMMDAVITRMSIVYLPLFIRLFL